MSSFTIDAILGLGAEGKNDAEEKSKQSVSSSEEGAEVFGKETTKETTESDRAEPLALSKWL